MNKQSAITNIVPELHMEYKSRDWLLSASAQRYFAGNLHHNTLLPIGLDLIKQTRSSAFFYRFHFQCWPDIFLSKNNVLQLRNREIAFSWLLQHQQCFDVYFSSMCFKMIKCVLNDFMNLAKCQHHGWE